MIPSFILNTAVFNHRHTNGPMAQIKRRFIGLLFILTSLCLRMSADSLGADSAEMVKVFETANSRYEEKNYSEATNLFLSLLEQDIYAATIFLNLGNCHVKMDQPESALVYYEQGLLLAPGSKSLKHNLVLAKTMLSESLGSPLEDSNNSYLRAMTLDQWGVVFAIPLTLTCLCFGWTFSGFQLLRQINGLLRGLAVPCLILSAAGGILYFMAQNEWTTVRGVIVSPQVAVRYGPVDVSEIAFNPSIGTYMEIIDSRPGWYQVIDSRNRKGWVEANEIHIITPASQALQYSKIPELSD